MTSDDLVHAIGDVTIEASYLEYCVAALVNRANQDNDEDVGEILSQVGGPLRELRKLLDQVKTEQAGWYPFYHSLARLERRFSAALERRNKLVHSVEVLRLSSNDPFPVEPKSWHPKTGDEGAPADVSDLHQLTAEMRHIGGWFLRLLHTADRWAHEHQPPPSANEVSDADQTQSPPFAPDASAKEIAQAAAALRAAVKGSGKPLLGSSAAQAVLANVPQMRENSWGGAGRFGDFVDKYVPDLIFVRRGPGYIYDPSKNNEADLPNT